MSSAFSLRKNSTPLDLNARHELKEVFTQGLKPDGFGKPTVYKGTLYHEGKQYLVTRFYEKERGGGDVVEKYAFSRQVDFEQPWPKVIENLFFVYVLEKTWIGQRHLENVRQEFEVLLKTNKDETRMAVPEHALAIDTSDDMSLVPVYKLFGAVVELQACREIQKSVYPSRRLDEAGYTGNARGALVTGGFQQPPCWLYAEGEDADLVFTLQDGTTRVTVDSRQLSHPKYEQIVGEIEKLSGEVHQLEGQMMRLAEDYSDLLTSEETDPAAATRHREQREKCENELREKTAELRGLQTKKAEFVEEARTLAVHLYEERKNGGWSLRQRRLFNAAVDQMWMVTEGIGVALGECPRGFTRGTTEERTEKKLLAQQFRKLFSLPDDPHRPDTNDVYIESGKLQKKIGDLRMDPRARRVIAERLSEDPALMAGMGPKQIKDVFDFFINTSLVL